MNTLLIRLSGPMQSWGVQSRFSMRDTGLEPSKSGVVGLLCAALGRPRTAPVEDLSSLIMGVRVDREGILSRDYHIAGTRGYLKAGGGVERKTVVPSTRYYLADAVFLVGLQSHALHMLEELQNALLHPVWPLYLGRKSFVPGEPVALNDGIITNSNVVEALRTFPYIGFGAPSEKFRVVIEDPDGDQVRHDQPISFSERLFAPRRVRTMFFPRQPFMGSPPSS